MKRPPVLDTTDDFCERWNLYDNKYGWIKEYEDFIWTLVILKVLL